MNDKVKLWVGQLSHFDWHTSFSDDHSVYMKGIRDTLELQEQWKQESLTQDEKDSVLEGCKVHYESYAKSLWHEDLLDVDSTPWNINNFVEHA